MIRYSPKSCTTNSTSASRLARDAAPQPARTPRRGSRVGAEEHLRIPPGRYMMLRDLDRVCATSRAASMRRSSTSAGPADLVAWLMSLADSDSHPRRG